MFSTLKFTVIFCTVWISICHAHLDPPTDLKAEWIDPLTVKVSWKRPKSVPHGCNILYELKLNNESVRTSKTHFLENLLTESGAKWVAKVRTVGTSDSCKDWKSSEVKINIEAKPKAVVKDFNCYLSESSMTCSWISDPSSPVSISFRDCGRTEFLLETGFRECNGTYSDGNRSYCQLSGNFIQTDLCIVATTPNGVSTFRAPKAVNLPNMTISEEETNLVLTLKPLAVQMGCFFYNICYSVCDKPRKCREYPLIEKQLKIPYDKSCQYTFQYRAQSSDYCKNVYSAWSENITYGSPDIPGNTDWTATVVAIVIPVIISACVILSCICFRRHKDIICPDVPYPSIIFKEMMNSNIEFKPNVSMYTPVQEPIEPILIVPHIPPSSGLVST